MDNLMVGHGKEIDKERVYGIFQYGGSHRGFGRFKSAVRLKKRFNKYVKEFKNIFFWNYSGYLITLIYLVLLLVEKQVRSNDFEFEWIVEK